MPDRNEQGSALESLRASYEARESEARHRKADGQKIVGYFTSNVPEELILAAGMFPVQLGGDYTLRPERGDAYMEYFHDGHIRSIFDRTLRGHFNFVDLLVVPRTSEGFLQLFYYLIETQRLEPDSEIPEVYLFDLLNTAFWRTGRYNRDRLDDLRRKLAEVAGRPIDTESITNAIRVVNENRRHLTRLMQLRHAQPSRLSGSDALRAIGSASFIDKQAHTRLLDAILVENKNEEAATSATSLPRLMVKGSTIDNTSLYDLIESCGAVVVASDHPWGEGTFEHLVREDADCMEALTEHYHLHSASVRQYPQAPQDARFLQSVEAANVQGVVFYLEEWDDTLGWDYPDQKRMLDALNIPSVLLKHQPYFKSDTTAQVEAIKQLIEAATRNVQAQELSA